MKTVEIAFLLLLGASSCISQDVDRTIDYLIGAEEFKTDERAALMALDKSATFKMVERLRLESEPTSESRLVGLLAQKYNQLKSGLSKAEELKIIELLVEKTRLSSGRFLDGKLASLQIVDHPLIETLANDVKSSTDDPKTLFYVDALLKRIAARSSQRKASGTPNGSPEVPERSDLVNPAPTPAVTTGATSQNSEVTVPRRWWPWVTAAIALSLIGWFALKRRS